MRASGLMPRRSASAADMSTTAAAPSEIEDEEAAVTVPSLRNAGFSVGILARSTVNGVSSLSTTVSPLRPLTVTGVISAAKAPAVHRLQRALRGFGGERVLLGAREAVLLRRGLGEAAHELAVERALQAVVEHVVQHFAVAHAHSRRAPWAVDRARCHGLEPAGHARRDVAGANLVGGHHDGLHARSRTSC